jgi:DNA recombination protein RmuC
MEIILLSVVLIITIVIVILFFTVKPAQNNDALLNKIDNLESNTARIESSVKEEIRISRNELNTLQKENRQELANNLASFQQTFIETLNSISKTQLEQLKNITESNQNALSQLSKTIEDKITALIGKTDENSKLNRDELSNSLKYFNDQLKERFSEVEKKQGELIIITEQKLEKMRETVDERLQKTLEARLGQSFELVSNQLKSVEQGLGEMKSLAQDVGGLKKVLSNVKMRGGIGEVQLEMLLSQILAPEQYDSNVKTKHGSSDLVEFAIKLPGKDDGHGVVYLPIDAKFPKDAYEQLVDAYESADVALIDAATKTIENVIKKMAKDIHEKYIDPPHTTDFGIMFLPFESIYAEVVRHTALIETLQRDFKIVVTGPTTLAAILNSLQMGFKTLAIQKRSSEVWNVLKAVKTEFAEFGKVLNSAQDKISKANEEIDKLVGTRTRKIQLRLKNIETLNPEEAREIIGDDKNDLFLDSEEQ